MIKGKTQSQKPSLIVGLEKSTRRRRLSRISEDVEEVDVRLESCLNVESSINPLLKTLGLEAQFGKDATSSKLSGETSSGTYTFGKEIPVTMDQERGPDPPPILPMPPIDPLV